MPFKRQSETLYATLLPYKYTVKFILQRRLSAIPSTHRADITCGESAFIGMNQSLGEIPVTVEGARHINLRPDSLQSGARAASWYVSRRYKYCAWPRIVAKAISYKAWAEAARSIM